MTKEYAFGADVMQILWDMILLLFILNSFLLNKRGNTEENTFGEIGILGITLYLMMFEGRAKYIYMLLPMYVYHAGIISKQFMEFYKEVSDSKIFTTRKRQNYIEIRKSSSKSFVSENKERLRLLLLP